VNIVDQSLELSPNLAHNGNPHYERYRTALKWIVVGGTAAALGLLVDSLGVKQGLDILSAAAPVAWLGGLGLAIEVPNLTEHE
jgi:hypothetical protein